MELQVGIIFFNQYEYFSITINESYINYPFQYLKLYVLYFFMEFIKVASSEFKKY